jgi:uncharacterized membrane-anchored protein
MSNPMLKPFLAGAVLLLATNLFAAPADSIKINSPKPDQIITEFKRQVDSIDQQLRFHTGKLKFTEQNIRITVPPNHYFVDGPQSRYILETLWGNAQDEEVLGMIVRSDFSPNETKGDYSFVVSYAPTGYISTPEKVDFDHHILLNKIQQQIHDNNTRRLEQGLNALQVERWVMVPFFDQYRKALYWATELKVNGSDESLINYNLRILGKDGVIKVNAVGTMDQLDGIKQILPYVLARTEFLEGYCYDDYNAATVVESDWKLEELIAGREEEGFFFGKSISLTVSAFIICGCIVGILSFSNFKRKPIGATA